ncbi:MAG: hypothetical protein O7G13_14505 [Alphaproteobacteria bacterium]|nr:hypothetical protein [Alphaproteobacteria bacterium]MCZ6840472.1 hypothetical protein [Alphaproteobacteria bacterium]
MQINNHFTPTNLGHGSRPDHAANAHGRAPQFQPATADAEPVATTDTATAVAPTEETEGPGKSGKSVAHEARAHPMFAELGGNNFGWLVSEIARGLYIAPEAPEGEGEGTDGVVVSTDEVGGDEVATAPDEADATGEESPPADETVDETADAGTPSEIVVEDPVASLLDTLTEESEDSTTQTADETTDPVADLVDILLEDNEDDSGVT